MKICVIKSGTIGVSETFIRAHAAQLPGHVELIEGKNPVWRGKEMLPETRWVAVRRVLAKSVGRYDAEHQRTKAYLRIFQEARPDVVLAEYGTTGVRLLPACTAAGVPLVVHFHGYDASRHEVIEKYRNAYQHLFQEAAGIVAVSHRMIEALVELGASRDKVYYSPCGADVEAFGPVQAGAAPLRFLSVGRLVEKKAPHLTLLAFAQVLQKYPEAKLCMIGDGPLFGVCRDIVQALGLDKAVEMLGAQPHGRVQDEMKKARAFLQHSVVAVDGDSEGTPVAVLEAGASALPVVSTRHAGIPDVVVEGETGFLVEEHDISGMAAKMVELIDNPDLATQIGQSARAHVLEQFSLQRSIERLGDAIQRSVEQYSAQNAQGNR